MIVGYTDNDGFKYRVVVPNDATPDMYQYGIRVGPPDLTSLGFDTVTERRLNNELFNRGLITKKDIGKRNNEIFAALQAVLRVDVTTIVELYSQIKEIN